MYMVFRKQKGFRQFLWEKGKKKCNGWIFPKLLSFYKMKLLTRKQSRKSSVFWTNILESRVWEIVRSKIWASYSFGYQGPIWRTDTILEAFDTRDQNMFIILWPQRSRAASISWSSFLISRKIVSSKNLIGLQLWPPESNKNVWHHFWNGKSSRTHPYSKKLPPRSNMSSKGRLASLKISQKCDSNEKASTRTKVLRS